MGNGIELGSAYISISARTDGMAKDIQAALNGSAKAADKAGADLGARLSKSASKAMRDGWRPDQDIMAGIPNTKLDQIGARIGQVIGKGVVGGLRAREAGVKFGHSFAEGAGSVGIGRVLAGWKSELAGGGALASMGRLAGKTFSAALTGAVGIGIAGAGMALTKGFQRLLTIDTAKFKLQGLGKSSKEVTDIVKTVTDAVTGTPFSLDEAFATATQAIGANVKDLKRFMTDVSDAAGFAGTDISRMGLVFNQILAKGKLTGEEMMQLMEAGLPAKSWIMESAKLTSDQFDDMQAKGKITMEMLQKAIEDHAGGMSKKLGDTLQGSIDNMQTAIARVGANFLSAIFGGPDGDATEGMKGAVQRITDALNNLDAWIKAHREDIREFFTSAKDAAAGLGRILGDILGYLKDHPGAIQAVVTAFVAWESIKGISTVVGAISGLSGALTALPALASGLIGPLSGIAALVAAIGISANNILTTKDAAGNSYLDGSKYGLFFGQPGAPGVPAGPGTSTAVAPRPGGFGVPNTQDALPGGGGFQSLPGFNMAPKGPGGVGGGMAVSGNVLPAGPMSGESTRDYAHRVGIPYWQSQGFTVGDHAADKHGEHQNGALDIMVPDLATGQDVLKKALADPNVYGAIFNNQTYGYGNGPTPQDYSSGHTGDPTQDHKNHVHIWYRPGNSGPLVPLEAPPIGGAGASQPAQSGDPLEWMKRLNLGTYNSGGSVFGAGSATSDSVPALLSNGEHVLSAKDVAAMGGQGGVYSFRQALHRAGGGEIATAQLPWMQGRPVGKIGEAAGNRPDLQPGPGYPGTIGLPDWGTPGTNFGAPPSDWWNKPINPDDILFPDFMPPGEKDWWLEIWGKKNKRIQGYANGGAVDQNLTPQQIEAMRTQGYIPAAAGNMGKAGDSTIAKGIGIGGEIINGLIDQAASAAATAASAAATAGSFGAGGQAAGPAAAAAIGLGANAAKRGVTYGFDMLGIGADTLLQQVMPFGMPRWLSTDPGAFMPNQAITGALGDLMSQGGAPAAKLPGGEQKWGGIGHTGDGPLQHNQPGPAIGGLMDSTQPPQAGGMTQHGTGAGNPPGPAPFENSANSFLSTELAQQGGSAPAPNGQPTVSIGTVYAQDPNELSMQIQKRQNLAAMQYTGRPGP